MQSISIIFFCILIFIGWSYLFLFSFKSNNKLNTLIFGLSLFYEVFFVLFPVIYSVFDNFSIESQMYALVTSEDIVKVLFGEVIFLFMFIIGFSIFQPKRSARFNLKAHTKTALNAEVLTLKILLIIGVIIYLPKALSTDFGDSHVITHLTTIFWYATLVAASFVFIHPFKHNKNYFWYFCALIIIISLIAITFITGVRGRILWIFLLLMIAAIFYKKYKYVLITIPFLMVMLPLFSILGTAQTRFEVLSGSPLENIQAVYQLATEENSSAISSPIDTFLESFVSRAQGVRNSATLYQDHDLGGGGFGIYLGALTSFVPTYLWEDKPILGSDSNDINGFAMYKVINLGYNRGGEMGPLLASAHAYWEGGWFWVVLAGAITGVIWHFIFAYGSKFPNILNAIIVFSFGASFMVDGFLTTMNPIFSIISMFLRSILPITLIYVASYRYMLKKNE